MTDAQLHLLVPGRVAAIQYESTQVGADHTRSRVVIVGPAATLAQTQWGAVGDNRPGHWVRESDAARYGRGGSAVKFFVHERILSISPTCSSTRFIRVAGLPYVRRALPDGSYATGPDRFELPTFN